MVLKIIASLPNPSLPNPGLPTPMPFKTTTAGGVLSKRYKSFCSKLHERSRQLRSGHPPAELSGRMIPSVALERFARSAGPIVGLNPVADYPVADSCQARLRQAEFLLA